MSSVAIDSTVVACDDLVATTVEGETVLLNNETGLYQGLHGVGPHIWELIQQPAEVAWVVETIGAEYDVEHQQCEQDVLDFLDELAAENLLEVNARASR